MNNAFFKLCIFRYVYNGFVKKFNSIKGLKIRVEYLYSVTKIKKKQINSYNDRMKLNIQAQLHNKMHIDQMFVQY